MRQRILILLLFMGMFMVPATPVFSQSKTQCPPKKAFWKKSHNTGFHLHQVPKITLFKRSDKERVKDEEVIAQTKQVKESKVNRKDLRRSYKRRSEFLKLNGKQVASTKCPK